MVTQIWALMLVNIFHKAIELGLHSMYAVLLHTINMLLQCQILNGNDLMLSLGKSDCSRVKWK